LLLKHLADETDTLADDRADQPLLLTGVADDSPGGADTARNGRVRNDPPAPDRSQQIVLADHPVSVSDEEFQEVENLRFHRQQRGPSAQLAPLRVESVILKPKQQYTARAACSARWRLDDLNAVCLREKSRRPQDHIKTVSKRGGTVGGI
jgi:hypothetical protein